LCSALIGTAALAGCADQDAPRPDPLVATMLVDAAHADGGRRLDGVIAARVDSTLSFRVPGQVVARLVLRGQQVRKGQSLVQIDAADLTLAASEAAAQAVATTQSVAAARAVAARAAADEARQRGLVASGSVSAQAYGAVKAAAVAADAELAAAEARSAAAQAAAARAGNQQRYATLVADADAIVTDILVDPGQLLAAGQPAVRLARAGPREILVTVPEYDRAALSATGTVNVVATGQSFPARLREISSAADPATRSFAARYTVGGADALLPGLTATIALAGKPGRGRSVAVSLGAVIDRGRGAAVWVVGKDARLARRPIAIDAIIDDQVQVSAGLAAGERVVVAGAHQLNAGQRVRIGSLPR
jgi:RND family efflux transporter MFP subunit